MIQIRPISDLRNKFVEIEKTVINGEPIFLTKNGYGSMVVMSIEKYSEITDNVEILLDEADILAEKSNIRYSHEEIFSRLKGNIK